MAMIFYCDTCDEYFTQDDVDDVKDGITDVPCPGCCMPLDHVGNDSPYDTMEEKWL